MFFWCATTICVAFSQLMYPRTLINAGYEPTKARHSRPLALSDSRPMLQQWPLGLVAFSTFVVVIINIGEERQKTEWALVTFRALKLRSETRECRAAAGK